jgi:hypothetical protein
MRQDSVESAKDAVSREVSSFPARLRAKVRQYATPSLPRRVRREDFKSTSGK